MMDIKNLTRQLNKQAKKIEEEIYKRTKRGKGVSKDGDNSRPFKRLSSSYVKQRESLQRTGKLASDTSPSTSNLTQTGDMLNDLNVSVRENDGNIEVTIGFNSNDSAKKAEYVSEDRPFMHLDARQVKELEETITESVTNSTIKDLNALIKRLF